MGKRLFVGNISWDAEDDQLKTFFVGSVSARIMREHDTGRSRGFAFVEMATEEEAGIAIEEYDGADFLGRPLRVSVATERRPRGEYQHRGGRGDRSYDQYA